MQATPLEILKRYWGYEQFRPLQEDIIHHILKGKDSLAILPTGGGKSVCYQVPALLMPGLTLVISPLIALMKDQASRLSSMKIPVATMQQGMTFREIRETLESAARGQLKFLFVSPERLQSNVFREYWPSLPVSLIAVDEAHCISQWGHDFRPAYRRILSLREDKPEVPVLALTASATRRVRQDIREQLDMLEAMEFQASFVRHNVTYRVEICDARMPAVLRVLQSNPGSALVYCRSRMRTRQVAEYLQQHGLPASFYHAGLSTEERTIRQETWLKGSSAIMVCTTAFGMGIDKADVRVVVHAEPSDCLENYYQEAGRAGRDGKPAMAVLLYQAQDLELLEQLTENRYPPIASIRKVYEALNYFLQIPEHTGEDSSFPFSLDTFTERFKLPGTAHVLYCLKALEQEGWLLFQEEDFSPSRVQVLLNRSEMEQVESSYPQWDEVIKLLLRGYGGVRDQPTAIRESNLSKLGFIEEKEIRQRLLQMDKAGLIRYWPRQDEPHIRLLRDRVRPSDLMLYPEAYLERKKHFRERVEAMIHYVKDTESCRTRLISLYFEEEQVSACGRCDNCVKPSGHVDEILRLLSDYVKQNDADTRQILNDFSKWPGEIVMQALDELSRQGLIEVGSRGEIKTRR